jgi:hypothetical protein
MRVGNSTGYVDQRRVEDVRIDASYRRSGELAVRQHLAIADVRRWSDSGLANKYVIDSAVCEFCR